MDIVVTVERGKHINQVHIFRRGIPENCRPMTSIETEDQSLIVLISGVAEIHICYLPDVWLRNYHQDHTESALSYVQSTLLC